MKLQSIRETAQRYGVDRSVSYAVGARLWQLMAGQLTALLIVFSMTTVEQGYYYAFLYLLAMQIFVELGLHVVLINVASHEWAGLRLSDGRVTGEPKSHARLSSLSATATRWYSVAALLFAGIVSATGWVYFDSTGLPDASAPAGAGTTMGFNWAAPWFTLVVLTALQLVILPKTSVLEGCDQLAVINRIRLIQNIVGSVVVWLIMLAGFGVWALCGSAAVRLAGEFYLVRRRYGDFFDSLQQSNTDDGVNWNTEILPLQWRIAVQGILLWFATHLNGLVLFKIHGEQTGGKFGLMWTVLTAVQGASLSWVETRRPLFGQLIAERKWTDLDSLFLRLSRISIALMIAGGGCFTLGVFVVNQYSNPIFDRIASRLPDVLSTAIYAGAFAILQPALCANLYVRAHKRDPFLVPGIVSSLSVAMLVVGLGFHYGIRGSAIGYLIGVGIVHTPIWIYVCVLCRREWQQDGVTAQ